MDNPESDLDGFCAELVESGELAEAEVAEIKRAAAGGPSAPKPDLAKASSDDEVRDLRAAIDDMKIPEKIKLAMFGNSTCRGLLVLDSNRLVQNAVMNNPQLQEGEIEVFAKNPNISDGVLRFISGKRTWMKSYQLKAALVTNPKTPGDIALKWLRYLHKADLRRIARSKNLPQLVAVNARKKLAEMDKRK